MTRPVFTKLLTKWHDDPKWRSRPAAERCLFLHFLSLVEFHGTEDVERGVVEYTKADLAAREGHTESQVKSMLARWERWGTIESMPPRRVDHTWVSRARVANFERLYGVGERPVESPVAHPVTSPVESPVTSLTRGSQIEEMGETRAGAREATLSLPGLESPEGDDRRLVHDGRERRDESPTSPVSTSASHSAAGVGPGAVDRAALGAEVNRVWADEFRRNGQRRNIDPGNHWSGKDATKALDQIKALAIYPLAEREGAMAALAEFRRVAKLHLDRDHLQSRGWPLWALAEDWHELSSGGVAGVAPKRETPAQRSGHWTEEDVRRATEQSQRTLAIIRENNARRGVR